MAEMVVPQGENAMTTQTIATRTTLFKVGWLALLVVAALMTLGHLVLLFVLNEPAVFVGWVAFNLYAALVIWFPFRRGERWAWFASWILVIAFASTILFNAEFGPIYLGIGVGMALGLLLTAPAFFQGNRPLGQAADNA
jgi:hypothetical protein